MGEEAAAPGATDEVATATVAPMGDTAAAGAGLGAAATGGAMATVPPRPAEGPDAFVAGGLPWAAPACAARMPCGGVCGEKGLGAASRGSSAPHRWQNFVVVLIVLRALRTRNQTLLLLRSHTALCFVVSAPGRGDQEKRCSWRCFGREGELLDPSSRLPFQNGAHTSCKRPRIFPVNVPFPGRRRRQGQRARVPVRDRTRKPPHS